MLSLQSAPRRGLAAGLAGVLVAGAASVLAAAPAQAAPVVGELRWNVSEQFVNHLSVRTLADGATFDSTTQKFAFPAVSQTTAPDGTRTVVYDGSVTGGFMTMYSVTISDPVVSVEADGDGRIQATVNSKGSNTDPDVSTAPTLVTVAEFSGANTTPTTLSVTPNWVNVLAPGSQTAIDLGITNPARPVEGKSFHPEFLGAIHSDIRPHFYFTTSGEAKRPGDIGATMVTATPAVTAAVSAASDAAVAGGSVDYNYAPSIPIVNAVANGVKIKVAGTGFNPTTNPGDAGIYVALAPSNTVINYADRASLATFPVVDYVTPARFSADTFATVLAAPTAKLVPGTSYSIFTWQAHTHSNATQDTKTPVAIDWTKLAAPGTPETPAVKADAAITLKIAKKPTRKKAGKARIAITGGDAVATGSVEFSIKTPGKKAKKVTAELNAKGVATVKLPKAKKRGKYKVVITYAGDSNFNKAKRVVTKFKVR